MKKTPEEILNDEFKNNLNKTVHNAITTKELVYVAMEKYKNQVNDRFQSLINDIADWSDETFGKYNRELPLTNHLTEEVKELLDALEIYKRAPNETSLINVNMEIVDCFMILVDIARMMGLSGQELINISEHKLEINKNRTWDKPDKNGVVRHVKS